MSNNLLDLIQAYWSSYIDPWEIIDDIIKVFDDNKLRDILFECSNGDEFRTKISLDKLLLTFRKWYEKLARPQTSSAASKECYEIVQQLRKRRCRNFEELYKEYRGKAWREATHRLVEEAVKGGMPLRYVPGYRGKDYMDEITNTFRRMYDLASKAAHGGRPQIGNIKVLCNNLLFLVLLGYYSKGPKQLNC